MTLWGCILGGQRFADAEPVTHLSWSGSAGVSYFPALHLLSSSKIVILFEGICLCEVILNYRLDSSLTSWLQEVVGVGLDRWMSGPLCTLRLLDVSTAGGDLQEGPNLLRLPDHVRYHPVLSTIDGPE